MNRKVLVIEDDQNDLALLLPVLSEAGFEITAVHSGSRGLEALRQQDYRVVMINLKLPDMKGIDLLRDIRSEFPGVIPAIVTGFDEPEMREQVFKAGATMFFPKPYRSENNLAMLAILAETERAYMQGTHRHWKTSIGGGLALVGGAITQVFPNYTSIGALLVAIGSGFGLIMARDK